MDTKNLFNGKFGLGVNYWASHASIRMWSDWDEKAVENDFKVLSESGINVVRVFPLWSDFQPVGRLLAGLGDYKEPCYVLKTAEGEVQLTKEGINEKCIEEFSVLCDLAEKYDLMMVVPLITGFMSGSTFVPEILAEKNILNDPFAIKMQIEFVRYFVKKFKDRKNIVAWELGNECNNLAHVSKPEDSWLWTYSIVSAVKLEDSTRPVISGMHGLCSEYGVKNGWSVENQADICDILTVHPYFLFTENCANDGILSTRAIVHSVAEQTMYKDLGNKECLVEEIGTLGGIYGDQETVAKFARANLLNAWAYKTLGMLWWTSFDQDNQAYAPYEWVDCERELGMFLSDRTPKKMVGEYKRFSEFFNKFGEIPDRERNIVCIAPENDYSGMFGMFMLAKRAGLEPIFANIDKPLPEAKLYAVAGNGSVRFMRRSIYLDLQKKISDGATVLVTYDGGCISNFEKFTGCNSKGRVQGDKAEFTVDGKTIAVNRKFRMLLKPNTAEVLLNDDNGEVLFTRNKFGKGNVLFFNAPVERYFVAKDKAADSNEPYHYIYSVAAKTAEINHVISRNNPNLYFTAHKLDEDKYLIVAVNNTKDEITDTFWLNGYKIAKVHYGNIDSNGKTTVAGTDGIIFEIEK